MAKHFKQVVISIVACTIGLTLSAGTTVRADQEIGRAVYVEVCQRCHGLITEQSSFLGIRILPVVVLPHGPNLSNIVGRPVGSIKTFRYSNAMRTFAATGAIWDKETLDQYLINSQQLVRGSYMYLKVAQPKRKQVIDYLDRVARHRD
ncbi:MAG: c-type cytochrome [Hyphomicrobiaceae bacterium]